MVTWRRFILIPVLGACATIQVNGVSVAEDDWHAAEAAIRARAGFDLDCRELEITPLGVSDSMNKLANMAGVAGCGKKAVYIRPVKDRDSQMWVLNQ